MSFYVTLREVRPAAAIQPGLNRRRQPGKELVVDRIERGETAASPSQKLPSTAIYCHFGAVRPLRPLQPFKFIIRPYSTAEGCWRPVDCAKAWDCGFESRTSNPPSVVLVFGATHQSTDSRWVVACRTPWMTTCEAS